MPKSISKMDEDQARIGFPWSAAEWQRANEYRI